MNQGLRVIAWSSNYEYGAPSSILLKTWSQDCVCPCTHMAPSIAPVKVLSKHTVISEQSVPVSSVWS